MKEIPPPAPLVFTPSNIQEDTEVEMLEKSNDELLEKIDLEGGLEAVKERIRLLQSLWKEMRNKELQENPCD